MTWLRVNRSSRIWATVFAATTLLTIVAAAAADEPVVIRGRVLLPDGKPAAGAALYWLQFKEQPPRKPGDVTMEKRAAADDDGRFEFSLREHDAPLEEMRRPLLAYLPGYGVDWLEIVQGEVPPEAVLRLVADHPIRGRITDTEGRRVAGATITVRVIAAAPDGGLDGFLTAWKQNWRDARRTLPRQCYAARLLPPFTAVTDREGRFELVGVGIGRLASVNIAAPGLVSEDLEIVNRDAFDAEPYNKAAQANMLPLMRARFTGLTGPVVEYVAETELVVRGTVFTGANREPVVRALVGAQAHGRNNPISTQTDEMGRFELRGVPLSQDATLRVYPYTPGGNLLSRTIRLDRAPGQTIVDVDVELKEGILVEGRVFDQATGRGVKSAVEFLPLPGNKYAEVPGFGSPRVRKAPTRTDDDGHFRILVMPGSGVVTAQVQSDRPQLGGRKPIAYRQASFSDEDGKRVPVTVDGEDRHFTDAYNHLHFLMGMSAVKFIDLAPGEGPATCDLALDPGKTATIAIEDEHGQPIANALIGGVGDCWPIAIKLAEPACAVYGLGDDRPRHVCVLQPERHLATSLTLTGGEQGPVTVRLGPAASVAGRALDGDGRPLADALVQISYQRRSAFELVLLANQDKSPIKTDAEGRFVVENILPGERFSLSFKRGDQFFGGPRITDEKRQLKPGEKLELGEFKATQLQ